MDQFVRRCVLLCFGKIIGITFTVYIGNKTKTLCFIRLRKLVIPGRIQYDPETVDHRISVRFHDLDHLL